MPNIITPARCEQRTSAQNIAKPTNTEWPSTPMKQRIAAISNRLIQQHVFASTKEVVRRHNGIRIAAATMQPCAHFL